MKHRNEHQQDLVLVACGIFLAYVAVFDASIFNLMTQGDLSSRWVVSVATVSAAGIPFFFSLGALKEGALPGWEAIFFYERMLKGPWFWVASALFTLSLIPIGFIRGGTYSAQGLLLTGLALGVAVYLLLTARRSA